MKGRPKSEAEQLAFFDGALERFVRARDSAGAIDHYLGLAGTSIRLSFAGEDETRVVTATAAGGRGRVLLEAWTRVADPARVEGTR